MKRKLFCSAALLASAILSQATVAKTAQTPANAELPNIIVIVADDQGYADLSVAGLADDVSTPSIDSIAKQGIRFTQAYVTSPICSTSRLGMITGMYTQKTGGYFYGEEGAISEKVGTIPEMLKQKDYVTGYVGKYHYGYHNEDSRDFPLNHGFDYFYGTDGVGRKHYLIHDDKKNDAFKAKMKKYQRKGQTLEMTSMWDNRTKVTPTGFSTEIFGEKARDFVRTNKDKPFYLQLAFNSVHNFTHQLPQEYRDKHNLNLIQDWDPAKEEYYTWYQRARYPNNPEGRAYYLAQLDFMDKEIGKLLDTVAELKLTENTLIVYVSDNGGSTPIYANNNPLRGSKYLLYEGGIRVPMIVSWPAKIAKGAVVENVVSTMDLLPTLANITGTKAHKFVDGQDITPLLLGKDTSIAHDTLIWDTGIGTAVRQGDWKLKTASDDWNANYEMVEVELGTQLYNLADDVGETTDLSKQHPEIVKKLQAIYQEWDAKMKAGI